MEESLMAKTSKPMTKAQLTAHLAESIDIPKKQAAEFLASLAETAYKEASRGFTVPGIGKLVKVRRKARMGRNPATGETIRIPAKTVVKFRISKICKDAVTPTKK